MGVVGKRIEKQIGLTMTRQMLANDTLGAKTSRVAAMPRSSASRRKLTLTQAFASGSHITLSGTAFSSRIQIAKMSGLILKALLKQQNTNRLFRQPAILP